MDSLGNPLIIGRYYRLQGFPEVRYIGTGNARNTFLFVWINHFNENTTIRRNIVAISGLNRPVLLDSDDETDNEFDDDPFDNYVVAKGYRKSKTKKYRKSKTKKYRKSKTKKYRKYRK
jgi:hypothetical protein